jgi:transposase
MFWRWFILRAMASKSPVPPNLADLTREELVAIIIQQSQLIAELQKRIEELLRKDRRQASPFSRDKPKTDPKQPGRKPGQGSFTRRSSPPEQPTDRKIHATPPRQCPDCGGAIDLERIDEATVIDIPSNVKPVITRYSVPVCRCQKCGAPVRGKAPGLAPDQTGATAHRLGPKVMEAAHDLHYGLGIPVRKVPPVLMALTGVRVTASAITQNAMKQSEGAVGAAYERLRHQLRECAAVHTDDTGWRIGGRNAYLMGFDSDRAAVYQIRTQHRNEEVQEIIPANYGGVLITDRGVSYDAKVFDGMRQQKCLAHLLKNISGVLETKTGSARRFGVELKALLREAIALSKATPGQPRNEKVEDLDIRLTWHLRDRILKDKDNQRLLDGIGQQMDRGRILTFLEVPGVEPTNNRAERMLRPAVIARKVSHCSKNERGAYATAAFLSVIQTARKGIAGVAPPS